MKKIYLLLAAICCVFTVNATPGALSGRFTVNADGQQIVFAQGNLQYQASTDTWRFATNQYDFVGDDEAGNVYENEVKSTNTKISESYDGWIDLFGWGTSGFDNKYPYTSSLSPEDYVFAAGDKDIAGTEYDWGIHNKISNGGNQSGMWRNLTQKEWEYLFHGRTNADILFGMGTVNNVSGTIILPDNWTEAPDGIVFNPSTTLGMAWQKDEKDGFEYYFNTTHNNFTHNTYSIDQWNALEELGAVFLPCAGYRIGTNAKWVVDDGDYWSSTLCKTNYPYHLSFYGNALYPQDNGSRRYSDYVGIGFSVRLVLSKNAEGMEPVTTNSSSNFRKFFHNGMLLIECDGKIYNAQGAQVR